MEAQDRGGWQPLAADHQQSCRKTGVGVRPEPRHARGNRGGGEGTRGFPRKPVREEAQLRSAYAVAGTRSRSEY